LPNTTVLFVCPDNTLLGPLAEAYLNGRANGLIRAFSAGDKTGSRLHPAVGKLLSAHGIPYDGLEPKSLDVFLMPHAPVPDRVIGLAGMSHGITRLQADLPADFQTWTITGTAPGPVSFASAAEYFRRIRLAIDRMLEPPASGGCARQANVA
jgi:arsenate reductase